MKLFFKPVSIASLAFFRFAFGIIMFWEVGRYFSYNWIKTHWYQNDFNFTYNFFHWVKPIPENLMYLLFAVLGILAIFIAIGFFYRVSVSLFFAGFSYIFLLEKAYYLNHFYLICLLLFILIFLPAHRNYSVDSFLTPRIKRNYIPFWVVLSLQLQVGIAYFYSGIAKLNADWLAGEPMRTWLKKSTDFFLIGKYFTEEWMIYIFVIGGLLFDLLIVPFLLFKKTRKIAFIIATIFHIANALLFKIGIFPWFMIFATTIYFKPNWCKNFFDTIFFNNNKDEKKINFKFNKAIVVAFCVYFFFQFTIPLRHFFIKGNPNWTEQGHRFAWHMKLRDKSSKVVFKVKNKDNDKTYLENPINHLTKRQISKMSGRPDMIWQYAQHLKQIYNKKGMNNIAVYADAKSRLNGRRIQNLVKKDYNLLQDEYYNEFNVEWILPLTTPLK